jgi:hypothetical protein
VVPTAYTAGYWRGLRARSTAQLELNSPATEFHNPQGTMGRHTVFLVEFGGGDSLPAARCRQAFEPRERRKRRSKLSKVELEERSCRSRTKAEIARLSREAEGSP